MELNTWERVRLLSLLPEKGNYVTLKIVHRLRQDLSFTEEEVSELQFRDDGDRMMWNPDADKLKEFQIGPKARELLVQKLEELNKSEALDHQLMLLFEKVADTTKYDLGGEA